MGCGRVKDGEDGGSKRHQGRGEMAVRDNRAGGDIDESGWSDGGMREGEVRWAQSQPAEG